MPAAWPLSVPRVLPIGYSETGPQNAFLVTPFDKGRPARRRNTLAAPRMANVRLVRITHAQLAVFEAWFETTLSGAALSFEMTHPITGAVREWAFASSEEPYRVTRLSHEFVTVAFDLALYPAI